MKKIRDYGVGRQSYLRKILIVCCFFMGLLWGPGQVFAQKEIRISLNMKNASIVQVFNEIKKQSGYEFVYSSDQLTGVKNVSIEVKDESLKNVLELCLANTGLGYKIEDKHIIISPRLKKEDTQKMMIYRGVVKDESGESLPGVTVILKGTRIGVTSDEKGAWVISVPENTDVQLVFSFVGMKKKEVVVKDQKPLEVVMVEDVNEMDEVVITGIFNKPKESFTGAAVKVTGEELRAAGNRNLLQSLSNIDPSFVIVENNDFGSNPNKLPEIRLRGVSTIPSVDELQTSTRAELCTPLFILDGFEITLERMMDLNNDEIASITILKDASATAIYGSRGANGVVVITSVKPEKGKLKVSYNVNMNLEIPDLGSYNLMNAKDKLQLEWDAGLYDDSGREFVDAQLKRIYAKKLERVLAGVDVDWISIPVRTGVGHNHFLGISGGDDAFRYSLGLSYNGVKGAMKGSDREVFNGTVTLSYLREKFSFNNTMSFGINSSENSPYGEFSTYAKMNSYWEPYDEKGQLVKKFETETNWVYNGVSNPLWDAYSNSFNRSKYNTITDNIALTYKPISDLQANLNISFTRSNSATDVYVSSTNSYYFGQEDVLKRGNRDYSSTDGYKWAISATLNYYKTWNQHVLSAGFNYELRESRDESRKISALGFVNDKMNALENAQSYNGTKPTSSDTKTRSVGFTGTVNYNFDNRYYVDASYRMDGASSFGSDSRFAPFWSVGAGWTISNEPWMRDNIGFINYMRMKYSFGCSGSMSFSPWQSQGTYQYQSLTYHGGIAASIRGLENPDLKWQNTYQHNVGFDFGIFQSKLSISANYYRKLTDNSITDMALPLSNGFKSYTGNSGEILNTGFDLSASFYVVRNVDKQISWSWVFGTSYNKNKLMKLSEAVKERMSELRGYQSTGLYYVYEEGQSVDAIYAVPTVGVDPSTGRMVYVYKDGTQSYRYDVSQRVVCGDRMPKLDGRLSTTFMWKGFSLNAGFTIRTGGQKYNSTYANKIENVNLAYNVDRRVQTERWINPGDEAIFSGLKEKNSYITDRYIQDERTFSCNNINLSYDFRQKWVRMIGFSRLAVTASMSNVFYWSTVKQERGTSYPYAFQPSFGLSCSF